MSQVESSTDSLAQLLQDEESAKLLASAAYENWDVAYLESALKQTSLNDKQQELMIKYWRAEKPKSHQKLIQEATWNNRLEKLSWRIDSKTKSRNVNELNELTSIVELKLGQGGSTSEVVRFEMTKDQLKRSWYR